MARLVRQVAVVEEGPRLQCLSMTSPSHESIHNFIILFIRIVFLGYYFLPYSFLNNIILKKLWIKRHIFKF